MKTLQHTSSAWKEDSANFALQVFLSSMSEIYSPEYIRSENTR
jgi:hypothetical protein